MRQSKTQIAKKLRNNATEAEKYLWYLLRAKNLGFKFRRQVVIGTYVVDFMCFEKRLIVEVDGGQHMHSKDDNERDDWLKERGYQVLRFWNNDVLGNRTGVVEKIVECLNHPRPNPPLKGEGISVVKIILKENRHYLGPMGGFHQMGDEHRHGQEKPDDDKDVEAQK